MQVRLEKSWQNMLSDEFEKSYFLKLVQFVRLQYQNNTCYPRGKNIFKSLDMCPFNKVRVIIIGQDPYHGPGQANGMCFSVSDGTTHPPSLINIFNEIKNDLKKPYPTSGDLSHWAKQGVLLLNSILTVRRGEPGSHQNQGWEFFTDAIIQSIAKNKSGVVYMLWGNYAKQKAKIVDRNKNLVLESGHPSPLSANRGLWFGNKHFSKCNSFLNEPIEW